MTNLGLTIRYSVVFAVILVKGTLAAISNIPDDRYKSLLAENTSLYEAKSDLLPAVLNTTTIENCVRNIFHTKDAQLLTTDCCLTKMCVNIRTVIADYPTLRELLLKLCNGKLQLKEKSHRCDTGDPRRVNNNTNSNAMTSYTEDCAIVNCSVNFHGETINGRALQINTEITGDLKKGSAKAKSTLVSWKSGPNIGTSNSTDINGNIGSRNVSVTSTRESSLQFLEIPAGNNMRIYDLRIDEEYLLFQAFSKLMGYLQPAGFPSDLLRDVLNNRIPFHFFMFQLLKLEISLVVWLMLWAMLSLCFPIAVVFSLCCSNNIRRLNEDFSNASMTSRERSTENILGFILHVLLVLLLLPIILILAGNEQVSRSISKSPATTDIIYEDINTFLRNTHMQISFVVTSSTDIAIETIRKDLEAIDTLLGKPYQQELSAETGIDIALVSLEELKISTSKVASLVSDLLNEYTLARTSGSLLQEQLRDIARQLTVARQQCGMNDRALCYTLQYSGFDVSFSVDNLTNDMKMRHLERIGTEKYFNSSIDSARKAFTEIREQVVFEAATAITDIKALLSRKRAEVYKSVHALDVLVRSLSETVTVGQKSASTIIQKMADWDLWRWLGVLGITSILSLIWGILLCGAPCGCGLTRKTIPLLLSGVGLSCIACIFSWGLGTISILVGGHGESLICRPLYDQPRYRTLGELVDAGGILYGAEGFFKTFIRRNDTINIAEVLRNCQRDQPAYQTFHLYNEINISKLANHKDWDDLTMILSNFTVAHSNMELLGPSLQLNLQMLSSITTANLTTLRLELSAPITKRDLSSFADQLNTVARQLTDPMNSRKIDNLASVARKVVHNEMRKLTEIRNRILYKITTLEVLLPPLNRQANQSLSHLKTIQYFLDNQGWRIAERARRQFISRIENYLEDLHNYVNTQITKEIGKCRPLWHIFHSARFCVCKLIVDPLNGMAFSSFFLILLFLTIAPVVIKLVEYYRENNEDVLASISHRRSRDGLIIDDEGTWVTPSSETPEVPMPLREIALTPADRARPTIWTSPSSSSLRQPSQRQVPPPSRSPSAISTRIKSPRMLQIPSLSRAKSPKNKLSSITSRIPKARNLTQMTVSRPRSPKRGRNHESLTLVEPIHWKSGSITPKSWM